MQPDIRNPLIELGYMIANALQSVTELSPEHYQQVVHSFLCFAEHYIRYRRLFEVHYPLSPTVLHYVIRYYQVLQYIVRYQIHGL